jgi:ubiquinone/menaquinone biosynthesis C-methylase UbiE
VGSEGLVIGADASLPMLEQAARSSAQRAVANTAYLHTGADALPFRNGQFDGINCTGALHLFEAAGTVLDQIARLLKPGGIFSCMTFCRTPLQFLNEAFRQAGVTLFDPQALMGELRSRGLTDYQGARSRMMLLFSVKKTG